MLTLYHCPPNGAPYWVGSFATKGEALAAMDRYIMLLQAIDAGLNQHEVVHNASHFQLVRERRDLRQLGSIVPPPPDEYDDVY